MNNVLKIFFLVLFITLTSCASKVEINPVVNVSTPSGLKKIKGKYAGYVQTGGWQLESKADGWNCSAWTFDVPTCSMNWLVQYYTFFKLYFIIFGFRQKVICII